MKSYILSCAFLLLYLSCFAQKAYNFGEGIVKIAHYFVLKRNVETPDTARSLFTNYTYYIKGSKVLKRETEDFSFSSTQHTTKKQDNSSFHTALTAKLVQPEYLLDFQNDTAYTFYKKKGKQMISQSRIEDQRSEIFFRALLSPKRNNNCILQTNQNKNGDTCAGYGYGIVGKDTAFFQYSMRHYPVQSPLACFFPDSTSPFITLLWLPTPGTDKDGKPISGFSVLTIKEVTDVKLPDSLFTIPADAIMKENVTMDEMYNPNIP
ncbi:hypothetical protein SAMN05660461_5319 [Chitinophaga ginsengisegetis]|uniref:GLPGLI family protein n=1 Tax=Chitinophaga ginsengisegetis TaxID=393003 RepID=A0A1T5P9N7_9BACT|nr:hypothetical protein [Chitinophaga ginsengisegetis]SKD09431.1 hypothetical protein SAMN05660461_5319 [Chitinophaga ginsengisegetis]